MEAIQDAVLDQLMILYCTIKISMSRQQCGRGRYFTLKQVSSFSHCNILSYHFDIVQFADSVQICINAN